MKSFLKRNILNIIVTSIGLLTIFVDRISSKNLGFGNYILTAGLIGIISNYIFPIEEGKEIKYANQNMLFLALLLILAIIIGIIMIL